MYCIVPLSLIVIALLAYIIVKIDDDVVARTCIPIFEMMTRDHFVLDDDYDDDMIWWDYLYVYSMIIFVCVWYARVYCIKPIQIQNKYA